MQDICLKRPPGLPRPEMGLGVQVLLGVVRNGCVFDFFKLYGRGVMFLAPGRGGLTVLKSFAGGGD